MHNDEVMPIVRTVSAVMFNAWQRARYYHRHHASITVKRVAGEAGISEPLAYAAMERVLSEEVTTPHAARSRMWRVLRWDEENIGEDRIPRRVWYEPSDEEAEGILAQCISEKCENGGETACRHLEEAPTAAVSLLSGE